MAGRPLVLTDCATAGGRRLWPSGLG